MNPDCDHPFEQYKRRLNMDNALFGVPIAKTCNFAFISYCDCSVLMPIQRPVHIRTLVKQDGSHGHRVVAQHIRNLGADSSIGCQQPGYRRTVNDSRPRCVLRETLKCEFQFGKDCLCEGSKMCSAVAVKGK